MPQLGLMTYKDVVDQMLDFVGTNAEQKATRDLKRAVLEAYREVASAHSWSFLRKHHRMNVVAPQSTGTITYTHTGGSSERLVTLSGSTWPTWATYGTLRVNDIDYEVDEYLTSTTITLRSSSNPGANVAAGTAYTLYRDSYTLPSDFVALNAPSREDFFGGLEYVSAGDWLAQRRSNYSAGEPSSFAIFGDPNVFQGLQIAFWPTFGTAQTVDFIYLRQPRDLTVFDHKDGTVSVVSGSTTVSGTGTNFTSSMVGSVIRLYKDSTLHPTAVWGDAPYAQERTILAYTDGNTIRVDAAINTGYTGVKYNVSDPIDLQKEMLNAFLRCCEQMLTSNRSMKEWMPRQAAYERALRDARSADRRYLDHQYMGGEAGGWSGPNTVTNAAVGE